EVASRAVVTNSRTASSVAQLARMRNSAATGAAQRRICIEISMITARRDCVAVPHVRTTRPSIPRQAAMVYTATYAFLHQGAAQPDDVFELRHLGRVVRDHHFVPHQYPEILRRSGRLH